MIPENGTYKVYKSDIKVFLDIFEKVFKKDSVSMLLL